MIITMQDQFLKNVFKLVEYIWAKDLLVTGGELWRTPEQQAIYYQSGKSKTMKSEHLNRMAIDLNIFTPDGKSASKGDMQDIGKYWESLNENCRWGGSWRGLVEEGKSNFIDSPHFEMKGIG